MTQKTKVQISQMYAERADWHSNWSKGYFDCYRFLRTCGGEKNRKARQMLRRAFLHEKKSVADKLSSLSSDRVELETRLSKANSSKPKINAQLAAVEKEIRQLNAQRDEINRRLVAIENKLSAQQD